MKKNNRFNKKYKAEIHNYSSEIKENILPIGKCKCSNILFMYLKSNPENITKYYCENKECEPGDIRNPKEGDIFFMAPIDLAKFLIETYGDSAKDLFVS